MAGHNKWSKIKHIKAKTDAQKGKAFSKAVREIVVAVKAGGPDPDMNPTLRLALQKARQSNMPKDNIKRAIEKAAGDGDDMNLEEVVYEAYGPQGVAVLIYTLTDNKNRTIPNIRTIITKAGGSMANKGAVSYLFEKKGVILFSDQHDHNLIFDFVTDKGADDVDIQDDGTIVVSMSADVFDGMCTALDSNKLAYLSADLQMVPSTVVTLDAAVSKKVLTMVQQLEDDDDVQNVYANYDISDDIMEAFFA